MTCEYRDDVAAHVLGALPTERAMEVDRHLRHCEECSKTWRDLAIVPTLLGSLEPEHLPGAPRQPVPADLGAASVARMLAGDRRGRVRRHARPFLAGVAAAVVLLVAPLGTYTFLHRPSAPQELSGTSAAPDAWAEARLHQRAGGGTIVDFEAGDLPSAGGAYQVVLRHGGTVVAREEFRADRDGWGRAVLATEREVSGGYTLTVVRRDGAHPTPVLTCDCHA